MSCYRQKQLLTLTSNIEINTPTSPPSTEIASPPTINMSVASPPSNKNIESTVKKAFQPSNIKKFYVQTSKSNVLHNIKDIL